MTFDDMPDSWEDCTTDQLVWLYQNGSYGQRLSAARWLTAKSQLRDAREMDLQNIEKANLLRVHIKRTGPPPVGLIKKYDRYGDGIDYGDYQ